MAIPIVYNVRSVFRRPAASFTTMVGVGFTVAILIGALALASGFHAALVSSGSPHNVLVLRKGADSEISSGLTRQTIDILRANPYVAPGPDGRPAVSADVVVLTNRARLGQPGSSNVTIRGIDPAAFPFRERANDVRIVDGRMFQPGTAEVVVGRKIAPRFADCGLGQQMQFGTRVFTVVGHFTAAGSSFESEIWGDNAVLMPVFRGDVYQSLTFAMRDTSQFAAAKQALESDPRLGVDVHRERDFYEQQSQMLATVMRVAGLFIVLIMGIGAVFGAMNTMFGSVGARTREIATLLVLGFGPGAVLLSFLAESVILALLGGALGCLIALPINGMVTSTTNFSSFSEVAFAFRVTPVILAVAMAFAAVMGVVGGFLPALRASRQPLARALRDL
ncbi:MAG TPA: ABC transporter permease [Candidatus Eisenbacteria bacterium]|nr:ABC transporter permease [Candidatus Eisenbacteria bacterium]